MSLAFDTLTLRGQAAAIACGDLDARELLETTVRRLETDGVALGAIVDTFERESARMLEAAPPGPLHGVPVVLKDMLALPWRAPQDGAARALEPSEPCASSVYELLRARGAVVAGIANMHQMGIGSTGHISAFGPSLNPWDVDRCAGGSSGGSAAAVAADLVAGAIGSDAGGSIRIPAAYCGLTGLKPTWGTVPVGGYTGAHSTLGAIGPLTRDAADCRLLAEVLMSRAFPPGDVAIRIGLVHEPMWADVDPAVAACCEAAVEVLRGSGCAVSHHELEATEHVVVATILGNGLDRLSSMTPAWFTENADALHPTIRAILKSRLLLPANVAARVTRLRTMLRRELARVFESVDVLVSPSAPTIAPPLIDLRLRLPSGRTSADIANLRLTGLANLTGVPAISVPCGLVDGMPVGLTLTAPWGREDLLLDLADRFERETAGEHVGRRADVLTTDGGSSTVTRPEHSL